MTGTSHHWPFLLGAVYSTHLSSPLKKVGKKEMRQVKKKNNKIRAKSHTDMLPQLPTLKSIDLSLKE